MSTSVTMHFTSIHISSLTFLRLKVLPPIEWPIKSCVAMIIGISQKRRIINERQIV